MMTNGNFQNVHFVEGYLSASVFPLSLYCERTTSLFGQRCPIGHNVDGQLVLTKSANHKLSSQY